MSIKVCHLTTVHQRFDVRIFHKELLSLSRAGYQTHLIVADGKGDEQAQGIQIHDIGKPSGRKERFVKYGKLALDKALELNADVYHFHDPELIPIGLKLKRLGKRVIYDAHENLPDQIRYKPYLNAFVRTFLAWGIKHYEHYAVARFDAVITVVPQIVERFKPYNRHVYLVRNFPSKREFEQITPWSARSSELCYLGAIHRAKGIVELIKAMEKVDTVLHLAGRFEDQELERQVKQLPGWQKVKYYGVVSRQEVLRILNQVRIGVVLFHPVRNYLHSLPLKMFEYFGAGLATIASDFPFWRQIVEQQDVALWINPLNPDAIAQSINQLLRDDKKAEKMGQKARQLVMEKLNWENEERTLLKAYEQVLESQ